MKTVVNIQTKTTETVPLTAEEQAQRDAEEAVYIANAPRRAALAEISRLEGEVTQRRLREAALGIDSGWLANQENLISIERAKI